MKSRNIAIVFPLIHLNHVAKLLAPIAGPVGSNLIKESILDFKKVGVTEDFTVETLKAPSMVGTTEYTLIYSKEFNMFSLRINSDEEIVIPATKFRSFFEDGTAYIHVGISEE